MRGHSKHRPKMDTIAKIGKGLAMQTTEITIPMNASFSPDERDTVLTKATAIAQRVDNHFEILSHCISRRVIIIKHWYNDSPAIFEESVLPAMNAVFEQKILNAKKEIEYMENQLKQDTTK